MITVSGSGGRPPPPGWHLPPVRERAVELELFDCVELLKLADGPVVDILTGVALHSGAPGAWPLLQGTTAAVLDSLTAHWRTQGRPGYAQFDNDTRFKGAHQHRDVFGRVVRLCLQLGITPVFVPPREFGLQNPIEHFNGLWHRKVWQRYRFASLAALTGVTAQYIAARRQRLGARLATTPARRPWPADWAWHPEQLPAGTSAPHPPHERARDAHLSGPYLDGRSPLVPPPRPGRGRSPAGGDPLLRAPPSGADGAAPAAGAAVSLPAPGPRSLTKITCHMSNREPSRDQIQLSPGRTGVPLDFGVHSKV